MSSKPSAALVRAAQRARTQPFFLASVFYAYQETNALDDTALSSQLGCSMNDLPQLALCRRPASEPTAFATDIDHLARRFHIDATQLANIIRQIDALQALRQHVNESEQASGMLRAARDREPNDQAGEEGNHD